MSQSSRAPVTAPRTLTVFGTTGLCNRTSGRVTDADTLDAALTRRGRFSWARCAAGDGL